MNVDLPNLTTIINSIEWGSSFGYPRLVTLESITQYGLLIDIRYSKCSKCHVAICIQNCNQSSSKE